MDVYTLLGRKYSSTPCSLGLGSQSKRVIGFEKEDSILVLGGQPEASTPTSLGRKVKMLGAGRQRVRVPAQTHRCYQAALGFLGWSLLIV